MKVCNSHRLPIAGSHCSPSNGCVIPDAARECIIKIHFIAHQIAIIGSIHHYAVHGIASLYPFHKEVRRRTVIIVRSQYRHSIGQLIPCYNIGCITSVIPPQTVSVMPNFPKSVPVCSPVKSRVSRLCVVNGQSPRRLSHPYIQVSRVSSKRVGIICIGGHATQSLIRVGVGVISVNVGLWVLSNVNPSVIANLWCSTIRSGYLCDLPSLASSRIVLHKVTLSICFARG